MVSRLHFENDIFRFKSWRVYKPTLTICQPFLLRSSRISRRSWPFPYSLQRHFSLDLFAQILVGD